MADPIDLSARLAALDADNARLRRLLDEAGTPDALRHGLRDTMAMLRAIMRQSAETAEDVASYVAHLEGRLDTLMRVRATADAFGEVDLHDLVSDELLFHLVREGERATIEGPRVRLRPKPAQIFALAVHEMASNAVEHGSLGEQGCVAVAWQAGNGAEPVMVFEWRESGGSGVLAPARRGFGSAVIEEMLAYEFGAQAARIVEADGLHWIVRFPLTGRIGRLLDESSEGDLPE